MKELIKKILKRSGIYHPLQSGYRSMLLFFVNNWYRIIYSRYKGKGYICNFCGCSYQKFVPDRPSKQIASVIEDNKVIAGYGENVFCPNCMSKNRERLVKAVIDDYINSDQKKLLHFSPEKHLYDYLKGKANVTTVDIMPGFYKSIDPSVTYADATALTFPDQMFDMIIANHILEHIPDDISAMREIYRVLKIDGIAILQVPYSELLAETIEDPNINNPEQQEKIFGQKDHVRIYSLNDYVGRLESCGFRIKLLRPHDLLQYRINAIQENESVILGYKPVL